MTYGASRINVEGVNPCLSADIYTKGLNADPGCLLAWVALLNSLVLKLKPPVKANTLPE